MTDQPDIASRTIFGRVRTYMDLVRFSHTVFALPFAVMALFLAYPGRFPELRTTLLILVCLVAARTAAMAYNRLVDRDIDERNPRTRSRHLPAGLVSAREVLLVVVASSLVFVIATLFLNRLAFALSFPVLFVLLGYSHAKRFTAASHYVLGLALGLAPLGVWVAARGAVDSSYWTPAVLGLSVLLWVAGFDILYSCQDVAFDRDAGLHSVPARLGVRRSLWVARVSHLSMVLCLLAVAWLASLGWLYLSGVAMAALLLLYEHRLVRPDDLSKINVAFFTVNGCISLLLCLFTVLEVVC